nr:hypothetical protein BJQ95_02201 [Cryobacterium sp. SO1]
MFESWHRRLPPGFVMSVKAPRGLTHAKKRYAPETNAPLVKLRLHGPAHDALSAGSFADADLRWWAHRIRE